MLGGATAPPVGCRLELSSAISYFISANYLNNKTAFSLIQVLWRSPCFTEIWHDKNNLEGTNPMLIFHDSDTEYILNFIFDSMRRSTSIPLSFEPRSTAAAGHNFQ